ncbi:hypothetical protein BD779DRAFT_474563 [Infundibulicybe gibba]|nr:hypothetical protein BD779DRAFT_474563 [Infundibulicybe gibba]
MDTDDDAPLSDPPMSPPVALGKRERVVSPTKNEDPRRPGRRSKGPITRANNPPGDDNAHNSRLTRKNRRNHRRNRGPRNASNYDMMWVLCIFHPVSCFLRPAFVAYVVPLLMLSLPLFCPFLYVVPLPCLFLLMRFFDCTNIFLNLMALLIV